MSGGSVGEVVPDVAECMTTLDAVHQVLTTAPMPLSLSTIAELTGADESRVQAALDSLAKEHLARRVDRRWVAGPSRRIARPLVASGRLR